MTSEPRTTPIRVPDRLFAELAAGGGSAQAVAFLERGERARRLLLLRTLLDRIAELSTPLTPVADAWEVVKDAAGRDPEAVDGLLLAPTTGAWIAHMLRRVHGTATGPPLWAEAGRLNVLALTAALLAGAETALTVPLADGGLHLPGLGRLRLPDAPPGPSVGLAVARAGEVTLSGPPRDGGARPTVTCRPASVPVESRPAGPGTAPTVETGPGSRWRPRRGAGCRRLRGRPRRPARGDRRRGPGVRGDRRRVRCRARGGGARRPTPRAGPADRRRVGRLAPAAHPHPPRPGRPRRHPPRRPRPLPRPRRPGPARPARRRGGGRVAAGVRRCRRGARRDRRRPGPGAARPGSDTRRRALRTHRRRPARRTDRRRLRVQRRLLRRHAHLPPRLGARPRRDPRPRVPAQQARRPAPSLPPPRRRPRGALLRPWRADPRHLTGLLHGAYAFTGVAGFWRDRLAEPEHAEVAAYHFALRRLQSRLVVRTLRTSARLTAPGSRLVAGLARTLDGWLRVPVAPDALRRARTAAALHRTQWRLRNLAAPAAPDGTLRFRPDRGFWPDTRTHAFAVRPAAPGPPTSTWPPATRPAPWTATPRTWPRTRPTRTRSPAGSSPARPWTPAAPPGAP